MPRAPFKNITRAITGLEGYTGPISAPQGYRSPAPVTVQVEEVALWHYPFLWDI